MKNDLIQKLADLQLSYDEQFRPHVVDPSRPESDFSKMVEVIDPSAIAMREQMSILGKKIMVLEELDEKLKTTESTSLEDLSKQGFSGRVRADKLAESAFENAGLAEKVRI